MQFMFKSYKYYSIFINSTAININGTIYKIAVSVLNQYAIVCRQGNEIQLNWMKTLINHGMPVHDKMDLSHKPDHSMLTHPHLVYG